MADDNVTSIDKKRKTIKIAEIPAGATSESDPGTEDEDKVSANVRMTDIADWIDRVPGSTIVGKFRAFPYSMLVVNPEKIGDPQIIAIDMNNTCHRMSLEEFSAEIVRQMAVLSTVTGFGLYFCNSARARAVAQFWSDRRARTLVMPQSVTFSDDPNPAFHRLTFPRPAASPSLELCPTWGDILGRLGENAAPFAAWVWSLFEEDSDRKQAVYIFGEKDCGKSRVSEALGRMMGSVTPSKGSFCTLSSQYIEGRWGVSGLVGKRLCAIDEAVPSFLGSSRHKALTGSKDQHAEDKGKPGFTVSINTKFLFTSNQAPECASRGDTLERLIVCRMVTHGKSSQDLIPDMQFDSLLDYELPAFLAVCRACYEPYKGGKRLACDYTELQAAMDEHEQFEDALFNRLFEVAGPEFFVSLNEIHATIAHDAAWTQQQTIKKYIRVWKDRFGIKAERRRVNGEKYRGYSGMKKKTQIDP